MSADTPRTDAEFKSHEHDMHDHISLEFAEQLERELNAALKQISVLREWIRGESDRGNICTYGILGEICPGCRCERIRKEMDSK